jgi:hypothetical protein
MSNAYGCNKVAEKPLNLHVTSFGMQSAFAAFAMSKCLMRWPLVEFIEKSPWEHFGTDRVVVLSPNAKEPLEDLDPSKVLAISEVLRSFAEILNCPRCT